MVKNSIEHLQNLAPHHYLDLQMNYWATYHHHKEQMGYVATALFLTGATTIMFFDLELTSCLEWARLLFTIIVTLLSVIAFVFWQLNNREFAAHMIRAYPKSAMSRRM